MPGQQSSDHKPSRLTGIQTLATIFTGLAGVAIAAYSAFNSQSSKDTTPQVQVTVAVDPTTGAVTQKQTPLAQGSAVNTPLSPQATATAGPAPTISTAAPLANSSTLAPGNGSVAVSAGASASDGKSDAIVSNETDLSQGAQFQAALKDGSDLRYNYAKLFDRDGKTGLEVTSPDSEINVLVSFAGDQPQHVSTIEYLPPITTGNAATVLDVMVLAEGQIDVGSPVQSFELQTTPGKQSFAIPGDVKGKAVWLRIAAPPKPGQATSDKFAVGEFRILN